MMEKKNLIKKKQKHINYLQRLNKKYYVAMKTAQETLDNYEANVAGQVTALTSHYEGIICYLMEKTSHVFLRESDVAEWAKGKEYALKSEYNGEDNLVWVPVVREVSEDDDQGLSETDRPEEE